jgi:glycopeptide antibiotics resistance protein
MCAVILPGLRFTCESKLGNMAMAPNYYIDIDSFLSIYFSQMHTMTTLIKYGLLNFNVLAPFGHLVDVSVLSCCLEILCVHI